MDWKLFGAVFGAVFLAELGDKTQIAALTLSASTQRPYLVFLAASAALIASTALGAAAGSWLGARIDPAWTQRAAGGLFIAMGAWLLWRPG
jgi:putative Ca2+/H+ antiporter (TMEM165/GDT1 family)